MSLVDYAIAVRRARNGAGCVCSLACGWRGR